LGHAPIEPVLLQDLLDFLAHILRAAVRVKNTSLGYLTTPRLYSHFQGLGRLLGLECTARMKRQQATGVYVDDSHNGQMLALQWDVAYIRLPDLIHPVDLQALNPIRTYLLRLPNGRLALIPPTFDPEPMAQADPFKEVTADRRPVPDLPVCCPAAHL